MEEALGFRAAKRFNHNSRVYRLALHVKQNEPSGRRAVEALRGSRRRV
jgi:hypothetical protein